MNPILYFGVPCGEQKRPALFLLETLLYWSNRVIPGRLTGGAVGCDLLGLCPKRIEPDGACGRSSRAIRKSPDASITNGPEGAWHRRLIRGALPLP